MGPNGQKSNRPAARRMKRARIASSNLVTNPKKYLRLILNYLPVLQAAAPLSCGLRIREALFHRGAFRQFSPCAGDVALRWILDSRKAHKP